MSIRALLQKEWPLLVLFGIGLAVCLTNYTPGTFLSGWDTLHPEFNLELNLSRAFFGVFQPQSGLGTVAAHSHIADLPHIVIVSFLSLFFPLSSIRYLFIFLCFIFGPVGMYLLLSHILPHRSTAFLGALFYMLSIGTIQIFYVPFEMFTVQYATLPWLFLFATDFLVTGNKKAFFFFCIVAILSSPMAYAQTLWYITFLVFTSYIGTYTFLFFRKQYQRSLKRPLLLTGILLALNLYWILPNIYFILLYGKTVTDAASNQLFSPQAFLYNKAFGNIANIALLRTFYFDWSIYRNASFTSLMQPWSTYMNNPVILFSGFLFFCIALLGIIGALIRRKTILLSFFPSLFLSLIFLFNDNLPFHLYQVLNTIPLFQEAFRFPDDKILGIFLFLYTLFFAVGVHLLTTWFSEKRLVSVIFFAIILSMLPVFTGHLISPAMRIQIPQQYFALFSYMQQEPMGKIATFPIDSPWGWEYYHWPRQQNSFQGSGFLWFGIPQPIMDRNYDRWDITNEDYYQEMSYAVYSQNPKLFDMVLKKYDISYLLLDTSIIAPGYKPQILFTTYLSHLVQTDSKIRRIATFGNTLSLYQTQFLSTQQLVSYQDNLPHIATKVEGTFLDSIYQHYGDYISDNTSSLQFPFASLTDNLSRLKTETIQSQPTGIQLTTTYPELFSPSFLTAEQTIPASVVLSENTKNVTLSIFPSTPTQKAQKPLVKHFILPASVRHVALSITPSFTVTFAPTPITQTYNLGTISLNTKQDTLSLFALDRAAKLPINLRQKNLAIRPCTGQSTGSVFGIKSILPTSLSLFGKDTLLCASLPLLSFVPNDTLSKSTLVLLTTSYKYNGADNSRLCVAQAQAGACLATSLQKIGSGPDNATLIAPSKIPALNLQIGFDTTQSTSFQEVTYKDITVALATPLAQETITTSDLERTFSTAPTTLPILSVQNPLVSPQNTLTTTTTNDCIYNPFLPTINSKRLVSREENYVEYSSANGSFCDHLSFTGLVPNQSYLLSVQSRTREGLPLSVCISDPKSGHCHVLTKLADTKQFATTYIVVPPFPTTALDINFNNFAVSPQTSTNDIASVSLAPFPLTWLSQIATHQLSATPHLASAITFHTFFNDSVIQTPYQQGDHATLVLSESFDPGFVLFSLPATTPTFLATTLPFLFGSTLGQHVLVDSWKNGWVLPSAKPNQQLVIVFLPQYLEYIGILLGILSISICIWAFYKRKLLNL